MEQGRNSIKEDMGRERHGVGEKLRVGVIVKNGIGNGLNWSMKMEEESEEEEEEQQQEEEEEEERIRECLGVVTKGSEEREGGN